MKKILSLILSIGMCISITACSNEKSEQTVETTDNVQTESTTKSKGDNALEEIESVSVYYYEQQELLKKALDEETYEDSEPDEYAVAEDYSNFGFENNFGMTEWISIAGYDFDDDGEMYVYALGWDQVVSFSDDFFKFYEKYDEYIENTVDSTADCSIKDNDTLTFDSGTFSGTSMLITERKIKNNVPMINSEFTKNYWGHTMIIKDSAWFIPVEFVDAERSPEKGVIVNSKGDKGSKFYLKSEYVQ